MSIAKMSHRRSARLIVCAAVLLAAGAAHAQDAEQAPAAPGTLPSGAVPRLVKFSGTLKDGAGQSRSGTVSVAFAVYAAEDGGAPLWLETQNVQADAQGRFTVLLGAASADGMPLELFSSGEPRWLGVRPHAESEAEQPRVLLVSVPYALKAADAETLGGRPASAFVMAEDTARVSNPDGEVSARGSDADRDEPGLLRGIGNPGFISMFTDRRQLGNSLFFETGGNIGLGTTTPKSKLDVFGNIRITGNGNGIFFPDGSFQGTAAPDGTITSIFTGTGLLGGPIFTSGTISLNTAFTDARYAQLGSASTPVTQNLSGALNLQGNITLTPLNGVNPTFTVRDADGSTFTVTNNAGFTTDTGSGGFIDPALPTPSSPGGALNIFGQSAPTSGTANGSSVNLQGGFGNNGIGGGINIQGGNGSFPNGGVAGGNINLRPGTGATNGVVNVFGDLQIAKGGLISFSDGTTISTGALAGSGTVTSIKSGFGLTGGNITTSGTLAVDTSVIPQLGTPTGLVHNIFWGDQDFQGNVTLTSGGKLTLSPFGMSFFDGTSQTTAGITQAAGDSRYAQLSASSNIFTGAVTANGGINTSGVTVSNASAGMGGPVTFLTPGTITTGSINTSGVTVGSAGAGGLVNINTSGVTVGGTGGGLGGGLTVVGPGVLTLANNSAPGNSSTISQNMNGELTLTSPSLTSSTTAGVTVSDASPSGITLSETGGSGGSAGGATLALYNTGVVTESGQVHRLQSVAVATTGLPSSSELLRYEGSSWNAGTGSPDTISFGASVVPDLSTSNTPKPTAQFQLNTATNNATPTVVFSLNQQGALTTKSSIGAPTVCIALDCRTAWPSGSGITSLTTTPGGALVTTPTPCTSAGICAIGITPGTIDGEVLRYSATNTAWLPSPLQAGDIPPLSSLYVDLSSTQSVGGAKTFTAPLTVTGNSAFTVATGTAFTATSADSTKPAAAITTTGAGPALHLNCPSTQPGSSTATPCFTMDTAGPYSIQLEVTDSLGNMSIAGTMTANNGVNLPSNCIPNATQACGSSPPIISTASAIDPGTGTPVSLTFSQAEEFCPSCFSRPSLFQYTWSISSTPSATPTPTGAATDPQGNWIGNGFLDAKTGISVGLPTGCGNNQTTLFTTSTVPPSWGCGNPSGGGTVTSVATGTGITGGPITSTGTLSLDTSFTDARYLQPNGNGSLLTNVNAVSLNGNPASTFASLVMPNTFLFPETFSSPVILNSTLNGTGSAVFTVSAGAAITATSADRTISAASITSTSGGPAIQANCTGTPAVTTVPCWVVYAEAPSALLVMDYLGNTTVAGTMTANNGLTAPSTGQATSTQNFASNSISSIASGYNPATGTAQSFTFSQAAVPVANPTGPLVKRYNWNFGDGTIADTPTGAATDPQGNWIGNGFLDAKTGISVGLPTGCGNNQTALFNISTVPASWGCGNLPAGGGTVTSVNAANASITIGGTDAAPTVAVTSPFIAVAPGAGLSTGSPTVPLGGTVTLSNTGVLGVTAAAGGPISVSPGQNPVVSLTGVIPVANGGTGSTTQNFVDLSSNQTAAGNKTLTGVLTANNFSTGSVSLSPTSGQTALNFSPMNVSGFVYVYGSGASVTAPIFNAATVNAGGSSATGTTVAAINSDASNSTLKATNNNITGTGASAVMATSNSGAAPTLVANNTSTTGTAPTGMFTSNSGAAAAVTGTNNAAGYGVSGSAIGAGSTGVVGSSSGASGIGVGGIASGVNSIGGDFSASGTNSIGVVAKATDPSGTPFTAIGASGTIVTVASNGAITLNGTITANGTLTVTNLNVTGSKNAVVPVAGERMVAVNALETPDSWFEDFGSGQLHDGRAQVKIEAGFLETVNTAYDYHVFLTPLGDCRGLYVAKRDAGGFEVRELGGGTANISFDYRIVAKRRGYETVRLEAVPGPSTGPNN